MKIDTANMLWINNTNQDVRMFDNVIINCVKLRIGLPEEINDIFKLTFVDDKTKKLGYFGILEML